MLNLKEPLLCDELKKLRCSVKPMDYDEVLDILNAEYNGNYQETIFPTTLSNCKIEIAFFKSLVSIIII